MICRFPIDALLALSCALPADSDSVKRPNVLFKDLRFTGHIHTATP
jgi:hypothetical protein